MADSSQFAADARLAERGLLGSILRDNAVLADVVQIVRQVDFYENRHQILFGAAVELWNDSKPVDTITLAKVLEPRGQIEDIGGYPYLAELWDVTFHAGHAEHYARIIRDNSIARRLVHAANEIARDAGDRILPADELLSQAEKSILEISELGVMGSATPIRQVIDETYDRMDSRDRGASGDGVPSGWIDLDNITAGFHDSELIIVGARPSTGKTSLALCMARHIAVELKLPVFFASLEQSRVELGERLLCCQARVDSHKVRRGYISSEERAKLSTAGDEIRQASMFIDDSPGQGMLRISANARRLKMRHGIRIVFVDYLQLIDPENKKESRQEQVAMFARRLKFLARELNIPVVAMAQLNRGVEHRSENKPRLFDLRESGAIEQDADTVLLLHKDEDSPDVVDVNVAKQRNGPTGSITLTFLKRFMRFENFAAEPNEVPFAQRDIPK